LPGPKDEAVVIVDALFDEVGATGGHSPHGDVPPVDGQDALLEMRDAKFPCWSEVEWAGYYLKYLVQKTCENQLSGQVEPLDLEHKRHFVKGRYVWDAHLSADDKNEVILGAVDEYADIIKTNGGIGVLVADSIVIKDDTGEFKRFQEELKGGISEYEIRREREGRPAQPRKEAFMIRKVFAYFFTLEDLRNGVETRWARDTFQRTMRNANARPRNGKYSIKIDSVPRQHLLFVKNFNEDPAEFGREYPEFV
jgi:hypothetical protein